MSFLLGILEAVGYLVELLDVLIKWRFWVPFVVCLLLALALYSSNAPEIAKTVGAVLVGLTGAAVGAVWQASSSQR